MKLTSITIILFCSFFIVLFAHAQPPSSYWEKAEKKYQSDYRQRIVDNMNMKPGKVTPAPSSDGPTPEFMKTKEQKAADATYVAEVTQREAAAYQREQDRIQDHKDFLQRIANENAERKRNYILSIFELFKGQKALTDLDIKMIGEEAFYFGNINKENKDYFKAASFVEKLRLGNMDEPFDTLMNYIWNARLFTDFSLGFLKKLQTEYPAQKSYLERNELRILANYFGANTPFQNSALGYIYPLCGFELMDDEQKIKTLNRFEELESIYPETAFKAAGDCRVGFNIFFKYATSNLLLKNKTDSKRLDYLYKTLETVQPERVLPAGGWRDDTWKLNADQYLRGTATELKLIYPDFVQNLTSEKWLAISDAYQINVEYIAWAFRDDYQHQSFLKKYPNLVNARKEEFKKEEDGDGTITFKNRDKYKGQIKDGKPNGEGKYTSAIGAIYEGNFKDGYLHGKGIAYSAKDIGNIIYKGDVYEGEFQDGARHGKGTLYNEYSNHKYEGDWKNGKKDGEGEQSFIDHFTKKISSYKGSYSKGHFEGSGILKNYDGSIYTGDFKNGEYDGKGVLKYADGSILIGEWNENEIISKAKLTCAKGYVKTYSREYDKKYKQYYEKNIKYFSPDGKEITEVEYNANK